MAADKRAAAWAYVRHRRPQAEEAQLWAWLYLADVQHLHQWGRSVSQTLYVAADPGPRWPEGVPSPMSVGEALLHLSRSDELALLAVLDEHGARSVSELQARVQDAAWRTRHAQGPGTLMTWEDLASLSADPEPLLAHLRDPQPGSAPRRR